MRHYISDYGKYSDDGKTVYGGYGPRLFGSAGSPNQIGYITRVLKLRPSTRKAVVQLFDKTDVVEEHKDIPCTCILQFFVRSGRLDLVVYMRSNDAFKGLPHDVFAFTFIQELVARSLDVDLGSYKHFVGSLHLYDCDRAKAQNFLSEGWQSTSLMQPMPSGDQWANVQRVLELEPRARYEAVLDLSSLPSYWADIVRLLQVFGQTGRKRPIAKLKAAMSSHAYDVYIDKRAGMRPKKKDGLR
jgi:thymidylate synthase